MDCACSCVTYEGRRGCADECAGGFMVAAYDYLQRIGAPPVRNAVAERGKCTAGGERYRCRGYYRVNLYNTFGIANARSGHVRLSPQNLQRNAANIAREITLHGPVSACFNMFSDFQTFWAHPRSADMVYEVGWQLPAAHRAALNPVGSTDWTARTGPGGIAFVTAHAVSIVGYGEQVVDGAVVRFWICRNSWGRPGNTYNSGFFKIRRGVNASAIESDVCAPHVVARDYGALVRSAAVFESVAPAGRTLAVIVVLVALLVVLTTAATVV